MVKVGLIGLGKMGLSHLAIVRPHPAVDVAAVCDGNGLLASAVADATGVPSYSRAEAMIEEADLDAVIVSTPSSSHARIVEASLAKGLHVFCEKPFVLDPVEGERLAETADRRQLVTQVGYHYRFVGAFQEAARLVESGALGDIHHVRAEAYGPVVLRPQGGTWRLQKNQGGGALYDYACHAIDLVNFVVGPPSEVHGTVLNSIFSHGVEDEAYCSLRFASGASGQLAVNWSDESYRKMSTRISVWGTRGRLVADRQECQVYLRQASPANGLDQGWTVRYTTDLTQPVWFYLRGEEYSAQIAYFIESVQLGRVGGTNSFHSALQTDRIVESIVTPADGSSSSSARVRPPSFNEWLGAWWARRPRRRSARPAETSRSAR